ncbi:MAG: flagellin [Thermobacillus sp. ZCTH02-B1]|uniref:flagellin N-terminal helical domain-containing protein n=1 Tax=Thermobacillus sp. ZCTH02-B1 TaxID=1858795 RepID=UPI000B56F45E|nr:flagellin [Thermobacillus sp. ZCTH02-B1]OUM94978.1 MAG: flagellin [Thermobacillus sp. ZCTH02-B1]
MSMYINTNVAAINAHRNLTFNNTQMGKTMEKLSSGYRINRAADDAAGLAVSEKMRYQINGYNQAMRNALDGISLLQTGEGALTEVHAMLQRLNVLATQAANGTLDDDDRAKLQLEVEQLLKEIDNIADTTEFNGIKLLDGTEGTVSFQVGFRANTTIDIDLSTGIGTAALSIDSINISTAAGAQTAISAIQNAISTVSELRANFGAVQNRLEHTINNLGVNVENLSASESRIRNADMAKEITEFTRNQILVQAGTAMLAQANAVPQNVLRLLG